jgi:hypothetical protein
MKLLKAFCLVTVLFALGTLMGCGTGESKYVGTYISESEVWDKTYGDYVRNVLEIKRDGTYRYETKGYLAGVTTGEWRVIKEEGVEAIDFIPGYPRGPMSLMKSRKGNNLVSTVSGEVFVKQR